MNGNRTDSQIRNDLLTKLALPNGRLEIEKEIEVFAGISRGIEEEGTFPGLYAVGEKYEQQLSPTLRKLRTNRR